MKRYTVFSLVLLMLLSFLFIAGNSSPTVYARHVASPTPNFDPLVEPYLPKDPSEYELGRYWYWYHCMTCHGNVGQGLTDEFRTFWPEDHQNCWAKGCHGGQRDDPGFPIPTFVPPLVSDSQLLQFSSFQSFYDYLKSTHPPQDPGALKDEEYRTIALYVFNMNNRVPEFSTPTSTMVPTLTITSVPEIIVETRTSARPIILIYIVLGILCVLVLIWML
ncbi:MAG: hypothetical protein GY755_11720 [Chloroflexi bacterium]|nr:hypothetical protein [Chloroflexota bacterium]